MNAFNLFQNSGQINQAVGFDKLIRFDMFMVRKRLQLACSWIRGIVIAEYDRTPLTMVVSINVFVYQSTFTLDKFLEIRNGPIPEFNSAREIGNITSFSIDGERIRRDEGMRRDDCFEVYDITIDTQS